MSSVGCSRSPTSDSARWVSAAAVPGPMRRGGADNSCRMRYMAVLLPGNGRNIGEISEVHELQLFGKPHRREHAQRREVLGRSHLVLDRDREGSQPFGEIL